MSTAELTPEPVIAAAGEPDATAATAGARWRRHVARGGVLIVLILVLASAVVRLAGLGQPNAINLLAALQAPSLSHPFGTDNLGRDVFIRTLYAGGVDIGFGVAYVVVAVTVGIVVGVVAGYFGRWVDATLMRIADFVLAFPLMVLVMAILVLFKSGIVGVFVAAAIKGWPAYARLARSDMLVLREQQFVLAARTMGLRRRRVIFRHMLPHVVRSSTVYAPQDMVTGIALLASLSYLGLGIQPPTPEWGAIIAGGQTYLLSAWWISTLPGLVMVLFGLGLSLTGEGLAESLRVHLGGSR